MPELPEVETIVRQLAPLLRRKTLERVTVYDHKLTEPDLESYFGWQVVRVARLGKEVVFVLASPQEHLRRIWLCVHLRMTGRLRYFEQQDPPPQLPYLRAWLRFASSGVAFQDVRRFGTWRLCHSLAEARPKGIDPLSPRWTHTRLKEQLADSRQPLKTWLMRQDRLVGIGNIYACEILYAARLSPTRPAGSLEQDNIHRLFSAIRRVLRRAVQHCGTTFSDFQDAYGMTGSYQALLRVYGRRGEPCHRCGCPIQVLRIAQRTTYYCPDCQRW